MKGLLLKEWYLLKNSIKAQAFSLILFVGLGIMMKSTVYVAMMVTILITNMILMIMSYDESCLWNRYAMTMPVSRRDLITVKYLMLGLLAVGSVVFTIIVGIPINLIAKISMKESIIMAAGCGLIAVWSMSFNIMLCTKLGVQKARLMTLLSYLLPFAALWILMMMMEKGLLHPERLQESHLILMALGVIGFVILGAFVMWKISCGILEKQDL